MGVLQEMTVDSSWEGGAPAILHHIPADDEIEGLYDIYTDRPVASPAPSDSSTESLFSTPGAIDYMGTWRFSFLPLRIMMPRFCRPLDPRIDVPMPTHCFLQNPMMRNSTTLIPALTLYGLMLIILCWHTTAMVHVYLKTRGPNFRKILGTSG